MVSGDVSCWGVFPFVRYLSASLRFHLLSPKTHKHSNVSQTETYPLTPEIYGGRRLLSKQSEVCKVPNLILNCWELHNLLCFFPTEVGAIKHNFQTNQEIIPILPLLIIHSIHCMITYYESISQYFSDTKGTVWIGNCEGFLHNVSFERCTNENTAQNPRIKSSSIISGPQLSPPIRTMHSASKAIVVAWAPIWYLEVRVSAYLSGVMVGCLCGALTAAREGSRTVSLCRVPLGRGRGGTELDWR